MSEHPGHVALAILSYVTCLCHLSKCPSGRSCGTEGPMRDPEEPAELAWPLPIQSLLMMGYTSACADVTHTPFSVSLKEAEKKTDRHHVRDLYNAFHGHCLPPSWELCKLGDLLVQIRTVRLLGGGTGTDQRAGHLRSWTMDVCCCLPILSSWGPGRTHCLLLSC